MSGYFILSCLSIDRSTKEVPLLLVVLEDMKSLYYSEMPDSLLYARIAAF